MTVISRISSHPVLSLVVSIATIVSAIIGILAWLAPARAPADNPAHNGAIAEPVTSGDLVGVWELRSPPQQDWVVEYRPDGTYVLTMPNARIHGVYEAENGAFVTRPESIGTDDHGSYRLLDADTLEMTGKLGGSLWARRR